MRIRTAGGRELKITIRAMPYPQMLCQVVLPYSNWGWATPCRSESMAVLSEGLQTALWRQTAAVVAHGAQ